MPGIHASVRTALRIIILLFIATGTAAGLSQAAEPAAMIPLTVSQPVRADQGRFNAGDTIQVDFTLPGDGPAVLGVYASAPYGAGVRWYANEGTRVAEFSVAGKAGPQAFTFRLDQLHKPAVALPLVGTVGTGGVGPLDPDNLSKLPGDFVIEVRSGNALGYVACGLFSANQPLLPNRTIPGFSMGGVCDASGAYIVADRQNWEARRFSADFKPLQAYPVVAGGASGPTECFDVAVDSKGDVYAAGAPGLLKYDAQGQQAAWDDNSDYIKCPYPTAVRNQLGVRVDSAARQRVTFGPGGGGAGSKEYGPEDVKNPGFAFQWGGVAIDAADNVYLSRLPSPQGTPAFTPDILVFNRAGKYLRTLGLPKGEAAVRLRFGKEGTLWIVTDREHLLGLDAVTGVARGHAADVAVGAQGRLFIGLDGVIYVNSHGGSRVWRFQADGQPYPFTAKAPYIQQGGLVLDLNPKAVNIPEGTAGYTALMSSVLADGQGDFYVATRDNSDPHGGGLDERIMHFSADGTFVPDSPSVTIRPHETGNIFVGNEPAGVDMQGINYTAQAAEVSVNTVVNNCDGQTLAALNSKFTVPPLRSVTTNVPCGDASAFGYYTINVDAKAGDHNLLSAAFFGGRLLPRGDTLPPYSPFGSVRMEANPELARRMGGGLNRGGATYWNSNETVPGGWHLPAADALNFYNRYAIPMMDILGYGEPWLNGGFDRCRITRYDTFWSYVATLVQRSKGTSAMYQCWNEPNYFWHVAGPFRYEQYEIVLEGVYSIGKALDPDAPVICDGFAGDDGTQMANLGKLGASRFTDAVPIHYPGATTLAFDNMPLHGTVESKAAVIKQLAAVRDAEYPGRPLLNTEEGFWGIENRTARTGAELLPRLYISQMAAGLDRLTFFETYSPTDPCYLLRGVQEGPWPAYFAYATASRFLEDAQYVGAISSGVAQVQLFAVKGRPIIVGWSMNDRADFNWKFKGSAALTDWQGQTLVPPPGESFSWMLGPAVQYLTGADPAIFDSFTESVRTQLQNGGATAKAFEVLRSNDKQMIELAPLFHAERVAEVLALGAAPVGQQSATPTTLDQANSAVGQAIEALHQAEKGGAYLRDARAALTIGQRAAYFMNLAGEQAPDYAQRLAPVVRGIATQVEQRATAEAKWYPGVMLRVALDTTALRAKIEPEIDAATEKSVARIARKDAWAALTDEARKDPANQQRIADLQKQVSADNAAPPIEATPLDEQFAPEVTKHPGDSVAVEMSVYNWMSQPLKGTITPVLPQGWNPQTSSADYAVDPQQHMRATILVSIPSDAAEGVYSIGMQTVYHGSVQRELHTYRVRIVK